MEEYEPTSSKRQGLTPGRGVRAGFGVAPILYMLGLIGVGAGVLFSSYSQSLKNNINMTNSVAVKNDLDAAATTLAATSVLGETDPSVLCPPQGGGASANCTGDPNLPTKMVEFYPTVNVTPTDPHLPSSYASADTGGSPVEVGIFTAGAGVKQIDPWGHYYVYCRWESAANSTTNPAFEIISAGPDGVVQTKCGATTASGDDQIISMNAANAVNRAAVWQTGTTGGNPDVYYGTTGHQLTVDALGNVTVPGNIAVTGDYTSTGTLAAGAISGTTGTFTGALTTSSTLSAESGAFSVGAGGTISATNGNFAVNSGGAISAAGTAFAIDSSGNLTSTGNVTIGTSTFTVAAASGNTSIAGTLGVIGTVTLGTSGASTVPSIITYGPVNIGTTLHTGSSRPLLSVGSTIPGTPSTYPFYVDQYGAVTASSVTASTFNGNLVGSQSGGSVSATTLTASGATTLSGSLGGTSAVFSGSVTASSFIGAVNLGNGGNTGIVPISNGGTGASTATTALANLGVTSGGYLNTALLTSGLIPGGDLVGNSVTINQLNTTGVSAGAYNWGTVTADGRVTFAQNVAESSGITDGSGDTITASNLAGNHALTFTVNSVQVGIWTPTGFGIGTTTPGAPLDINGNVRIENAAGQATPNQLQLMTGATSERWAITTDGVAESGTNVGSDFALNSYNNSGVAIGTEMTLTRVGNATFTGTVSSTEFFGSGAGLTNIGTSSIVGTLGEGNGGTGSSTTFTTGSVVFAAASSYAQDNAHFFWDVTNHKLGIGTVTPASAIETYNGEVQVGSSGVGCSGTNAGALRYSGGSAYVCDGANWDVFGGSSGGGTLYLGTSATAPNPAASATDTQTGLYTAGAGKVDVTSAGTQIAEFNAGGLNVVTGNVGIGTTAPTWPLTVTSSSNPSITLNSLGGALVTAATYFRAYSSRGTIGVPSNILNGDPLGGLAISGYWTGKANNEYINGDARAQVIGVATENWVSASNNGMALSFLTTANGTNALSERMRIDHSGNVGIGTTSPGDMFDVYATASGANTRVAALLDPSQTVGYYIFQDIGQALSTDNAAQMMFYYAGAGSTSNRFGLGFHGTSEFFSLTAAGNVGIGTTSPNSLLQAYNGEVQVGSSGVGCSGTNAGALRYSGGKAYVCDGSAWDLFGGSTGGTLPPLADDNIWIGNGSSVATARTLSQDVTITDTGVATVGKIQNVTVGSPTGTAASAVVLAASPTLTGTITAANLTLSGYYSNTFGSDYTTSSPVTQSDVNLGTSSTVRFNGTAAVAFEGIVAGAGGQELRLHNASAYMLTLADQSDSSDGTAANKIITGTAADLPVPANTSVTLQYDATAARWRVTGSSNAAKALAAGSDTQVQYNNNGNMAAEANFTWDYTNHRLGIGTSAAPLSKLDIYGGVAVGTSYAGVTAAPTNGMIVQGNVGIGSTSPIALLDVEGSSTNTTTQYINALFGGAQSTANTSTYYGLKTGPTYTATSGNTLAGLVGITNAPANSSTGTVTSMWGDYTAPLNNSSGTVGSMYGVLSIPTKVSTGVVTTMYGLYSRCDNKNATGAVTTCYELYLDTPTLTGAITNNYGVYQTYTSAINYFAGNVGIGTTAPGALFTVGNNTFEVNSTGNVTLNASTPNITMTETGGWGQIIIARGRANSNADQAAFISVPYGAYSASNPYWAAGIEPNTGDTWGVDTWDGSSIISRISIAPNTGNVGIGTTSPGALLDVGSAGPSGTLGTMRLEGNTSGYVQIQPAAAAGSWTMTLPGSAGTNTYVLQTNGSGVTSWVAASSSFTGLTTGDLCTAASGTAIACASTLSGDVTSAGGTATVTTVAKIQGTTVSGTTGSTNVVFSTSPTLTGTISAANLTLSGYDANTFGSDYTTSSPVTQSDVNLGTSSTVRFNGTAAVAFEGIVAGAGGQELRLHNASTHTLTLADQSDSTDGTAANKIITGTAADLPVPANTSVTLQYDATAARWRVTGSSNAAKALAAGSDTQIQYNNSGNMAGSSGLVYNYSSGYVGIGTSSPGQNLTIEGTAPIAEIRSGGYLMIRPTANNWDMRLQAVNSRLDVLSGGSLGSPIATFVDGGNVGIGTTTPARPLQVMVSDAATTNATSYPLRLSHKTSGTAGDNLGTGIEFQVQNPSGTMETIGTYEGERWADTSGTSSWWTVNMLTGGVMSHGGIAGGDDPMDFGTWEDSSHTAGTYISEIDLTSVGNEQPYMDLYRANGVSGAMTTVASGNILGAYEWNGYDGTGMHTSARIMGVVNGTVATNSIPTDMTFNTGVTGGGTEKMRITSGGLVGIGLASPGGVLDVVSSDVYQTNCGTESTSCPTPAGTGYGLVLDSNYTNGQFRYRMQPIDRGGNLSLYVQEAGGTANSFSNLARFGTNQYDTNTFAVFGNQYVSGNVGIGTTSPGAALDITATGTGNGQGSQGALAFRVDDGISRPIIAAYGNIDGNALADATATALAVRDVSGTGRSITTAGEIYAGNGGGSIASIITAGNVGIGSTVPITSLDMSQEHDALALPVGTTGNRPTGGNLTAGEIRYNQTSPPTIEAYVNGSWISLVGGGSGGGGTTNYVARWISSTTLGIGSLYDTGTLVSVGTTTTASALGVYGGVSIGTSYVGTAAPTNGMIVQGNVGIGTTVDAVFDNVNSARPLVVQSASTATTVGSGTNSIAIVNSDTTTNNTSSLIFADITGASTNQYADAEIVAIHGARTNTQYNSGQLAFMTAPGSNVAPAERVRIDNNGNVGIGTTAPAATLDAEEAAGHHVGLRNASIYGGLSTAAGIEAYNDGASALIPLQIDASPLLLNSIGGGSVGIGTTVPGATLQVKGSGVLVGATYLDGDTNNYGLNIQTNQAGGNYAYLGIIRGGNAGMYFTQVANQLAIGPNLNGTSPYIAINNANTNIGYVGIGTTAPGAKLAVSGGNSFLNDQANSGAAARNFGPKLWTDNLFGMELGNNGTLWTTRVYTRDADGGIEFGKYPTGSITNVNQFSPWMTLINNGSVGIGTTSPGRQLQVMVSDAATTNANAYPLRLSHKTSGTAGNNLGTGIEFEAQNPSGTMETIGTFAGERWADTSGTSTWWEMNMMTGGVMDSAAATNVGDDAIDFGTWQGGSAGSYISEFDLNSVGNDQPYVDLLRANGVTGARTAVVSGNNLGAYQWGGYDGTNNQWPAQIQATVNGTVSAGSVPTDITFWTGTNNSPTEKMRITSGGNVGIGTTTPGAPLSIVYNSTGLLNLGGTNIAISGGNSGGNLHIESPTTAMYLNYYSNKPIYTGTGYVGIGTTSPATLLHVNGVETVGLNGGTGGQITLNGATSGSVALKVAAAAGASTVFQLPATNGTVNYYLQTDGTGVTSWAAGTLPALASTDVWVGNGSNVATATATTGTGNVVMSASPTLTGTITAAAANFSGNVGIGTTSSSSTLDVGGTSNSAFVQNLAAWGLNAREQGIIIMPEGSVTDDGAGNLTFGSTVIVMDPLSGSWERIASGTYALGAWGALYVPIPSTGSERTVITPTVTAWVDSDRNYDGRDRVLLAQRMAGGQIMTRFGQYANLTGATGAYVTTGSVGIGTTSPGAKLHVSGGNVLLDNNEYFQTKDDAGTARIVLGTGTDGTVEIFGYHQTPMMYGVNGNTYIYGSGGSATLGLTVTSGGNVGIGTTSPADEFQVYGSASGADSRVVSVVDPSQSAGHYVYEDLGQAISTDNAAQIMFYYAGAGSASNRFGLGFHGTSEFFSLTAAGNVGIGTTAPASKLHTYGSNGTITVNNYGQMYDDGNFHVHSTTGPLWLNSADASGVYINNQNNGKVILTNGTGYVGIGTTGPNETLTVGYNSGASTPLSGTTNAAGVDVYMLSNAQAYIDALTAGSSGTQLNLRTYNNGTYNNGISITSAGNVGIGTTGPGTLLQVGGGTIPTGLGGLEVATNGNSYISVSDNTREAFLGADSSGEGMVGTITNHNFAIRSNNTDRITVLAGGNVGVGTGSPGDQLTVYNSTPANGAVYVSGNSNTGWPAASYYSADSGTSGRTYAFGSRNGVGFSISDETAAAVRFIINSAGNVGIGTTSPRTALDTWLGTLSGAENDYKQGQFTMSGGGTVTWAGTGGYLKWTARFIAIPMSSITASDGYISITEPTSGSIPAGQMYSGVARSWSGSGIVLNNWEALYAVHTPGGANTAINYYIVQYQTAFNPPSNWLLVAAINGDDGSVKLGNAVTLASGGTWSAGGGSGPYVNLQSATPGTQQTGNMNISGTGIFSGAVGIGTTVPRGWLEIRGTTPSYALTDSAAGADGKTYDFYNSGGVLQGRLINDAYSSATNWVQVARSGMTLNSVSFPNGNVGIGTTSPGVKLDVVGAAIGSAPNVRATGDMQLGFGAASGGALFFGSGGYSYASGDYIQETAAGTLQIFGGGTNAAATQLVVKNGSVGIGTASPSAPLHVVGGGTSYATAFLVDTNAASGGSTIVLGNNVASGDQVRIGLNGWLYSESSVFQVSSNTGTPLTFAIAGAEKMRINTTGNVGIGTTGPATPLEVSGVIQVRDAAVAPDNGYNGALRITRADSTGQYINMVRAGISGWSIGTVYNSSTFAIGGIAGTDSSFSPAFVITTGGNAGIGTTAPASQLTVSGAGQTTGNFATAGSLAGALEVDDTGTVAGNGGAIVFSADAQAWKFAAIKGYVTNGASNSQGDITFSVRPTAANAALTEAMRIQSSGNVGIDTPSPNGILDVSTNANGRLGAANGVSDGIVFYQSRDNASSIQSYIDGHWSDRTTYAGPCCNDLYINADVGTVTIGNTTADGTVTFPGAVTFSGAVTFNGSNTWTGTVTAQTFVVSGGGGTYGAGSIYSDGNYGMIIRAKQASPAVDDFLFQNAGNTTDISIDPSGNTSIARGALTVAGGISASSNVMTGLGRGTNFNYNTLASATAGPGGTRWQDGGGTNTNGPENSGNTTGILLQFDPLWTAIPNAYQMQISNPTDGTLWTRYDNNGTWAGWEQFILANSSGNVGIGTTVPSRPLHVYGTGGTVSLSTSSGEVAYFDNSISQGLAIGAMSASPYSMWLQTKRATNDGTSWPLALNPLGGNVGIGSTTPGEPLDVNGVIRSNSEIISTIGSGSYGGFRLVGGNYGAFFRNDGSNTYFLLTASGSQYGGWNSLRPFAVNDSTGAVSMANGVAVTGGLTTDTLTATGLLYPSGGLEFPENSWMYAPGGVGRSWYIGPTDQYWEVGSTTGDFHFRNSSDADLSVIAGASGRTTYFNAGNVGIGTTSPSYILDINVPDGVVAAQSRLRLADTTTNGNGAPGAIPTIEVVGARGDGNSTFEGRLAVSDRRSDGTAIASGQILGALAFGGQYGADTTFQAAKLLYPASVQGLAEGNFTASGTMPTALAFFTGSTGQDISAANNSYGTERMRIDHNGNVGIGTTAPASKLDVMDSTNTMTYQLRMGYQDSATDYGIGRSPGTGFLNFYGTQSGYNGYVFGGVDRTMMTILNNGNVGIGTTAPASKLTVQATGQGTTAFNTAGSLANVLELDDVGTAAGYGGAIMFSAAAQAWKFATIQGYVTNGASNSQGDITFSTRPGATDSTLTEAMRIQSSGYVGIGTAGPDSKLESYLVGSSVTAVHGYGYGTSATGVYGQGFGSGSVGVYASASGSGAFGVYSAAGTNYFAGNVGIGTTSPGGLLEYYISGVNYGVLGGANGGGSTNKLVTQATSGGSGLEVYDQNGSSNSIYILNLTNNVGGTEASKFVVTDAGNVGIGTSSPNGLLEVRPGTNETLLVRGPVSASSGVSISAVNDANNAWVPIQLDGSTIIMGMAGNVGIGTTVPAYKLEVLGPAGDWAARFDAGAGGGAVYLADGAGYGGYIDAGSSAGSGTYALNVNKSGGTPYLYVRGDGWVGINGTPNYAFEVHGDTANFYAINNPTTVAGARQITVGENSNNTNYRLAVGYSDIASVWTGVIQATSNGTGSVLAVNANGGNVGIGTTTPAYTLEVNGDIRADGWLRTSGATGWYSDTYGGGWNMSDTTWIRSYNSKQVYMSNGFDTGNPAAVGCGGGMGAGYSFRVCGTENITGTTTAAGTIYANGADGWSGTYAYYGYNGAQYEGVWTSLDAYSMIASNRILAPIYDAYSDMRKKTDIAPITLDDGLDFVRKVNPVSFHWKKDVENGGKAPLNNGYIAQQLLAAGYGNLVNGTQDEKDKNLVEREDTFDGVKVKSVAGVALSANYLGAIPLLHAALRSLLDKVEALAARVAGLAADEVKIIARLAAHDDQLAALKAANDNLEQEVVVLTESVVALQDEIKKNNNQTKGKK